MMNQILLEFMKTNLFYKNIISKAFFMALLFIFLIPIAVFAQTVPTLPAYCNPLPEDIDLLMECNDLISQIPGTPFDDTTGPVNGPGTGTYGMASAYNPTNNTILFVSSVLNGPSIPAQLYNATTMEPIGGQLTIDQSNLFVGSPRVVYNSVANNFFVTWQDERPSDTRSSIYGRFVNADGSMPASDFAVFNTGNTFIGDLIVDYTNSRYVQNFDMMPDGPRMVTISFDGTVGAVNNLEIVSSRYEGQSSMTYNSELNEYWYTYATVVGGGDTPQQDGRIMLARVNATTLERVGDPIQLSATRLGASAFSSPQIAYSADDGAAVVAWQEMGRTPGMKSEVYGRRINNDLSMSPEYPILTATTYSGSDFYGAPTNMKYNSSTGTFAMAVEDNNGGTTYAEFMSDGTVLEVREIIQPTGRNGNFNPCLGTTATGFTSCASVDQGRAVVTTYESNFRVAPSTPAAPAGTARLDKPDTTKFARLLSQIYLYTLGLAGLLAVAMSVLGGYLVMSARGNAAQASKGRDFIYSSLIGLVLLFGAFIILNTINPDLTKFDFSSLGNVGNNRRP